MASTSISFTLELHMVFNCLTFVAFFAVVLALNALPLSWKTRKVQLLVASYVFYAAWNPPFVILLWISTVVDWYAARGLVNAKRERSRHLWMLVSVVANLGMLGYFKYGQFLMDNFALALTAIGVAWQAPHDSIVLPVGISFYTFATMSYTLDIYLRRAEPASKLLDYALFVTFFPHLVAGPIMRPTELVPQFAVERRATGDQLRFGLALMTLGLFNKVVLADTLLSGVVEGVFDNSTAPGALDAWMGTLAFSGQIFCDFAGYSTTAIGAALCLGFAMPDNFRFPYAAVGFSDFWRRWHITLSSWLRDYLYIPLGGNRRGVVRTYVALMLTMLLGGLWHGAAWTFVIWGGLHGLYLAAERGLRKRFKGYLPGPLAMLGLALLTYLLINVTWVFFRAHSFTRAGQILAGMVGLNGAAAPLLPSYSLIKVPILIGALLIIHWRMRSSTLEAVVARSPALVVSAAWALMAFFVVIAQGTGNAFIYFQF